MNFTPKIYPPIPFAHYFEVKVGGGVCLNIQLVFHVPPWFLAMLHSRKTLVVANE